MYSWTNDDQVKTSGSMSPQTPPLLKLNLNMVSLAVLERLFNALVLIMQLIVAREFVSLSLRSAISSSFLQTLALSILVVIVIDSVAVFGLVLTIYGMAMAFFHMNPGNVVPLMGSDDSYAELQSKMQKQKLNRCCSVEDELCKSDKTTCFDHAACEGIDEEEIDDDEYSPVCPRSRNPTVGKAKTWTKSLLSF